MLYDVAIIGGGPAGLAAACYALQAQLRVALITPNLGGKINYRFQLRDLPAVESVHGADLVQQFASYVEAKVTTYLPLEARQLIVARNGEFQLTLEDSEALSARAVILAMGAQPQRLYVPGEREFIGRGVSFSAVSHASFFRDRAVAVVGGERALEAVLKLAAFAKRVYFILAHERELSPSGMVERAIADPKITIFRHWEVQAISGDQFVTHLNLVGINGEMRALPVEGVFIELGLLPNNALARDLVVIDEAGRIAVNQHCETSVPGIFAAGDVTDVYAEQVPVAIGEGAKAALSVWSYLATHPYRAVVGAAAPVTSGVATPEMPRE